MVPNNRTAVRFLPISKLPTPSKVLVVRKADSTRALADSFLGILQAQVPASPA